ncbi:hypothetical protein BUALT_Bualt19G0098600 [Buddleja alternifolia]|uniref:GTD-binding domain-containing protein n=1 Tax=Buddleja alternifolia TaxID=168488 RepID=A0AAV6W367_9LAMI|nr:hypothetical protein BUALT_Bualt19G0098600 [Buddleja alternifolia]
MDEVSFLKHIISDCESGYVFFLLENIKEVSEVLGLLMLFAFGFKSLSDWFWRSLVQFLCHLRGKLRNGFFSKNVFDGKCLLSKFSKENREHSNLHLDPDEKMSTESDGEFDAECDVSVLRKTIQIERRRANAAFEELEKERAASATAAEEAMAMILRLQREKSSIEMESNQYRRLAEEKQFHDEEVIRSLQWLVWRHESEMNVFDDQLKSCTMKSEDVENLLYCCSLDFNDSPSKLSSRSSDSEQRQSVVVTGEWWGLASGAMEEGACESEAKRGIFV